MCPRMSNYWHNPSREKCWMYVYLFELNTHDSSWWRHQMETFSALLAICVGNSPVTGEFPTQRPVTRRFDLFFDLGLNERLSKQSQGWWFETPPRPLWRHSNAIGGIVSLSRIVLGMGSANAKWRYIITSSLIVWAFAKRHCVFYLYSKYCVQAQN